MCIVCVCIVCVCVVCVCVCSGTYGAFVQGGSYTAEEKGGTPWLRLLSRRAREGKGYFLGF